MKTRFNIYFIHRSKNWHKSKFISFTIFKFHSCKIFLFQNHKSFFNKPIFPTFPIFLDTKLNSHTYIYIQFSGFTFKKLTTVRKDGFCSSSIGCIEARTAKQGIFHEILMKASPDFLFDLFDIPLEFRGPRKILPRSSVNEGELSADTRRY